MAAFPVDCDLHLHSICSACCRDPQMTPERIYELALSRGDRALCLTDHLWDAAVPGASDWYARQDIAHVRKALPLPGGGDCRFLFGCETEYLGGEALGLSPAHFDAFDMIVIPPNHFHMLDFVRPREADTEEKVARLLLSRLRELSALALPWRKVGIAHLTCNLTFREGDPLRVFELMEEEPLYDALRAFARLGAGIELNAASFPDGWRAREGAALRIFRVAKAAGCRFYCASDAHSLPDLARVRARLPEVAHLLGLSDSDLFFPEP